MSIFSRRSTKALSMLVPSAKVTMTMELPSLEMDWSSSMPDTEAQALSKVRVRRFSTS